MPKSQQAVALESLAAELTEQNTLLRGVVVKLDLALELLGDPTEEALGNDPAEEALGNDPAEEALGNDPAEVPPLDVEE